jgi:hypothetical protein
VKMTVVGTLRATLAVTAALLVTACGEEASRTDYMKIAGGGLTFNFRYSEARAVIVGRQVTPLPDGATVEALFDIPGQSRREKVAQPASSGRIIYKLQSGPLKGIKKGVPLNVTLIVTDVSGKEIDRDETQFVSDVDQDTLPSKPLVDPARPNYVPLPENL